MTPQELMDLKGYGSAEKVLRKTGKWKLTPLEVLYSVQDYQLSVSNNAKIDHAIAILEEKNQ